MTTHDSANIASHLSAAAASRPDVRAVVMAESGRSYTYAELDQRSDDVARGLMEVGVGPGIRAVLLAPPSLDFFTLVFALFKTGAVMVCIDPGIGVKYLKQCLGEAEPSAFIGVAKAHIARRLFGWAKQTLKTNIRVGGWAPLLGCDQTLEGLRKRGASSNHALPSSAPNDDAAILFTSGSTGPPKGVVYTHANFQAQVEALRSEFNIERGEVDLSTFPLFALFAPALGMTAIVPQMDFTRPGSVDPRKVLGPAQEYEANNLFGSPALLKRVGEYAMNATSEAGQLKLPSLNRIVSAGAPVPASVIEMVTNMLSDGAQVHTPYGATESLPVSTIGSDEILGETAKLTDQGKGVCVGRPVASIDARVIRITDDPIDTWSDDLLVQTGTIGEIVVRGPQVTRTYFNRDEQTRLAKIAAPQHGDGAFYHRMGDVGYLDEQGRLWMCGRKSQRVKTAEGDLYTVPCEAVFNTHPDVARTALVGIQIGSSQGGVRPTVCVELVHPGAADNRGTIRKDLLDLASKHDHTRSIIDVLFYDGLFPVDIRHNAKINREQLARWATRKMKGLRP